MSFVWEPPPRAHRLLGYPVVVQAPVGGRHRRVGRGVHGLVLLLLGHLLEGQETVLSHLDALGHVTHAGVFWKHTLENWRVNVCTLHTDLFRMY